MTLLLLFTGERTPSLVVTDTDILQKPVDAVLAGQQPLKDRYVEYDIRPKNLRTKTRARTPGARRLEGDPPTFSTTSTKKGYD